MAQADNETIRTLFTRMVNMSPSELETWLETPMSKSVGWKGPSGRAPESVGHASGRKIVRILRARNEELTADDYAHMRKVIGFVRRHCAQEPANIYTSRWRYSLMNWGHDPVKEDER